MEKYFYHFHYENLEEIKLSNNSPLFQQFHDQLQIKIFSGFYKCSARIGNLNELAYSLNINFNLVKKVMQMLEEEELVKKNAAGIWHVTSDEETLQKRRIAFMEKELEKFTNLMHSIGLTDDDIINHLNDN